MDINIFLQIAILVVIVGLLVLKSRKKILVPEGFVLVVLKNGRFSCVYDPGRYFLWSIGIDYGTFFFPTTQQQIIVANQEIMTKDRLPVKISVVVTYLLKNARLLYGALGKEYPSIVYSKIQIELRTVLTDLLSEDLTNERDTISSNLRKNLEPYFQSIGLDLLDAQIRDITFSKHVQTLVLKKLTAQYEADAKLIAAQAEIAATRALINAGNLIEQHPGLKFLKYIQVLENGKVTILQDQKNIGI